MSHWQSHDRREWYWECDPIGRRSAAMKIAVLGAGNVGGTLGEGWTRHGHEVYFGVRDPGSDSVRALLQRCGPRARAESIADAVRSGEVVVIALPWGAMKPA